ncbi:MAG: tRNA uridine(34) 5-carboxymethylaminomethyl modification radical SAM/GNAT enzyme Elp3 [Propionibacteriaceae bacterium]|jgi:elongator complex protein 3|nr:tRNA uridine(34) 5-carboxymethylaminomethyl modification radical SAM/GNAT enzyme Elp3 [Propionibacteriaceae bacterium]
MEAIILEILSELRTTGDVDAQFLRGIIHRHNRGILDNDHHFAKNKLLPFYSKVKQEQPERWASWGIDEKTEKRLLQILRVKPRRTSSGVATITVITKPWKCASDCLFCPNDLRMPKSYLSDEPACQRAEYNFFDPYLQVASRLRALKQMGHITDKIELIVLGGTWSDYAMGYQVWFITELFRALNDGDQRDEQARQRWDYYQAKGLDNSVEGRTAWVGHVQAEVDAGEISYNRGFDLLYGRDETWQSIAADQTASLDDLYVQHSRNEVARHRVVGLVIETRPDTINAKNLTLLRQLGCTKVQMGVQSLDRDILKMNRRAISVEKIEEAFTLLRLFGFKIHVHFMLNLLGATPEMDEQDYMRLVTERPFQPDEVKLYPCALVAGTGLGAHYQDGTWRPYTEQELMQVLVADTLNTPAFVRISRMIREFSADDIVVGNKKTNLRQMVESAIEASGQKSAEIRHREISTSAINVENLTVETVAYQGIGSDEYFLQWVTTEQRIAGFLRLSLPSRDYVGDLGADLPIKPGEAMIREVHIYGRVAELHQKGSASQHLGLGKELIEAACAVARDQGFHSINVISSVGTREYYRSLGFADNGLYQQKPL